MDAPLPPPVVAVAASAGGVEALRHFVAVLPLDLPAAVLVVLHIPATGPSVLPSLLDRAGPLPADHAQDGAPLLAGRILVAPPGQHLRVEDGHAAVQAGPRLDGHRPSADALFLSAAHDLGPRAAGVVLSGTMDDGAAGLRAIDLAGGLALVQDPEEAAFPNMPRAALARAPGATVCGIDTMGRRLAAWAGGDRRPHRRLRGPDRVHEAPANDPATGHRPTGAEDGTRDGSQDGSPERAAPTCPERGDSLVVDRERPMARYGQELDRVHTQIALLRGVIDDLVARGP